MAKPSGTQWYRRTFTRKPCVHCKKLYPPVAGGQRYCGKCRPLFRNGTFTRLYWLTQRRRCRHCQLTFAPQDSRQVYCTKFCQSKQALKRRTLQRKLFRMERLKRPRQCPSCENVFVATSNYQGFCCEACRPSQMLIKGGYRQSSAYRIGRMTPAEYAFSRIAKDQGRDLTFLEPSSRLFRFNGECYTPDFFEAATNTYIEVTGTRQAYHANKAKYHRFRNAYPAFTLKIVKPDGTDITVRKQ